MDAGARSCVEVPEKFGLPNEPADHPRNGFIQDFRAPGEQRGNDNQLKVRSYPRLRVAALFVYRIFTKKTE